ncbi:hypothetical protein AYO41_04170 [Verrucomicrobia bacterium SCGC AG-212-E04]|nr:hypothetical protein AYO41_04170 [Verrucomicrobia bacterium SCGC AG-212-E04]
MKLRSLQYLGALGVVSMLVAAAPSLRASSFSLFGDQSVTGAGTAGAGGAATAFDGSTIYYNPAGMSFLEDKVTNTFGFNWIVPSLEFTNNGSRTAGGTPLSQPTRGESPANSNNAGFFNSSVPQFYLAYKINDRFAVGIGVNAPFGLETDYNETSVVRYNATNSRITNVNINPSISFKILDNLSIGAGFNASYTQVALSNAIDFGLIGASVVGGLPPALAPVTPIIVAGLGGAAGVSPQNRDGFARFYGDSWSYGWNVGLMYEPLKGTRLGLSFRSNLKNDIGGYARYTNVPNYLGVITSVAAVSPAAAVAITPTFTGLAARFINNRPISADLDLPMSASGSFSQKVTPAWTILGDATWIRWSSVQQIAITYVDTPALSPAPAPLNYKNIFRYSLGTTYEAGAALFRFGLAYDNTPVENGGTRTPRLPDSDRVTIAAGMSYRMSKSIRVDLAYNHLFFQTVGINNSDGLGHVLSGTYRTNANIFSAGGSFLFGAPTPALRPQPKTVYTK